jgi:hypothetical protein
MISDRDHQPLITALTCRYRVQMVVVATMDNRYCRSCLSGGMCEDVKVRAGTGSRQEPVNVVVTALVHGLRASPPYSSTGDAIEGTAVGRSGRHSGADTNPGSTHSRPSKNVAISAGSRFR